MTEDRVIQWGRVWLGALLSGLVTFAMALASAAVPATFPTVVLGVVLLVVIVGLAWRFNRSGDRGMAIGMLAGYAVLSLMSAGQCTLWLESDGLESAALVGFFVYPLLLAGTGLIGGVVYLIRSRRKGEEGES